MRETFRSRVRVITLMGWQTGLGSGDSRKQLAEHCHQTFEMQTVTHRNFEVCSVSVTESLRDELSKDFTSDRFNGSSLHANICCPSRLQSRSHLHFLNYFPCRCKIISLDLDSSLREDVRVFFERNKSRTTVRHLLTSRANLFRCSRLAGDVVGVCARTARLCVLSTTPAAFCVPSIDDVKERDVTRQTNFCIDVAKSQRLKLVLFCILMYEKETKWKKVKILVYVW